MNRKGDAFIKLALVLSALLIGIAFGRWGAPPATILTNPSEQRSSPNDGLKSKALLAAPAPSHQTTDAGAARQSQVEALAALLHERGGSQHLRQLTDFVDNLAPGDFAAALLAARKLPRSADRDLTTRLLVARWAEVDPDRALAFAAEHREFDQVTGDVFQQLAANDLAGTLTRAQAMTDPNLRYQALRGVLGVMAETDPAGALRTAASAGTVDNNEPLSQVIYRQWATVDPVAAATAAAQDAGSGRRSPLGDVLRNWANQDPQSALNFALTISDASAQGRSVGEIVARWSTQDAGAAAGWINSMPAGTVRDAAAAAFASSVASTDLPTAVGWAQSIVDEEARTSALRRVSRHVIWRDPTNGATALQSAGVPAEILQNLPPPRR